MFLKLTFLLLENASSDSELLYTQTFGCKQPSLIRAVVKWSSFKSLLLTKT